MLLFLAAVLTLLLAGVLLLPGLCGSHGHLLALLRGQPRPEPKYLQRHVA